MITFLRTVCVCVCLCVYYFILFSFFCALCVRESACVRKSVCEREHASAWVCVRAM